ncbi:MAG TPA: hypothetical protein VFY05_04900 [Candidatus Angelobacter sp.]|nr:hypothetical protein [Candidatus Angelobacter sp.]
MKADSITRAGEQIKANVSEIADKARDISVKVKEQWGDTYRDLERGARRVKFATEERAADVRHQIKSRPLTVVCSVAAGSFSLGLLVGLLLGRKTRD